MTDRRIQILINDLSCRPISNAFTFFIGLLLCYCTGCGSGGGHPGLIDQVGKASDPVTEAISDAVDDLVTGTNSDGNDTLTNINLCEPAYPPAILPVEVGNDSVRRVREYASFHRVAPLSDTDLDRIEEYLEKPCFAHHLWNSEAEVIGCQHGLYHSAFERVRWPGLEYVEPSTEGSVAYVESFVADLSHPIDGVPFDSPFLGETTNDMMARWILDHAWVDPATGESPVRRWLLWDQDLDDDRAWVNEPYPANGYAENPNWHNDDGNATVMWPLDPLSEVQLLRDQLDHLDAHPEYGKGQGRTVAIHLDNFNAPNGGNRPFRGWVLGNEHREAYKEMIRRMADLLHSRGMFLIVNNLRADHPQDLWDLPFDGLHKEYSFSEDELKRVRQLLKGRVFYAKSKTQLDSLEVAQRIFDYGGRPKSIWPGETRPPEWFKPCGTLAGQWGLDEAEGVEARDFTFYYNHGRLRGAPQWVKGKTGAALLFDGSGDGVEIDRSETLSITESLSVSAWIRPLRDAAQTATGVEDILLGPSYRVRLNDGLMLTFGIRDPSALETTAGDGYWVELAADRALPLDHWTHVAATYDSARREMRLYVEGALVGSHVTGHDGAASADGRLTCLATGVEFSGLDNPYQGMLDEVYIYRRVLDGEAVRDLYDESILAAHWRLDEEEGEYSRVFIANDSSAYVNYGVVSGNAQWTSGVRGNALSFPGGTDDHVEIKHSGSLEIGETLTVALWLYLERDPSEAGEMNVLLGPSYRLTIDGTNNIQFSIHDVDVVERDATGWSTLASSSSLPNGEWVHVAASYDYSSQEMRVYVDGVLDNVGNVRLDPTTCGVRGLEPLPGPCYLSSGSHPYHGILDDVRVYNVTLSPAEVLATLGD